MTPTDKYSLSRYWYSFVSTYDYDIQKNVLIKSVISTHRFTKHGIDNNHKEDILFPSHIFNIKQRCQFKCNSD